MSLEICLDPVAAVRTAVAAGADRVELMQTNSRPC